MPRTGKNTLPQDFDWYAWERRAQQAGYPLVCGIDEAGRGPLAGPVCAAAVILPLDCAIEGLNDSKKLTEKKREALFPIIQEKALAWGIGWASAEEIDQINILQATFLAMKRCGGPAGAAPRGLGGREPHALSENSRGGGGKGGCPVCQHCCGLGFSQGQP